MAIYEVSLAAADAVVDRDIWRDRPDVRTSDVARVITGVAMAGSGAANDTVAELKVGSTTVAYVRNITTGNPTNDHIQPLNAFVPAAAPVSMPITDAAVTNPLITRLITEDLE